MCRYTRTPHARVHMHTRHTCVCMHVRGCGYACVRGTHTHTTVNSVPTVPRIRKAKGPDVQETRPEGASLPRAESGRVSSSLVSGSIWGSSCARPSGENAVTLLISHRDAVPMWKSKTDSPGPDSLSEASCWQRLGPPGAPTRGTASPPRTRGPLSPVSCC